jgi:hypothetical protein
MFAKTLNKLASSINEILFAVKVKFVKSLVAFTIIF